MRCAPPVAGDESRGRLLDELPQGLEPRGLADDLEVGEIAAFEDGVEPFDLVEDPAGGTRAHRGATTDEGGVHGVDGAAVEAGDQVVARPTEQLDHHGQGLADLEGDATQAHLGREHRLLDLEPELLAVLLGHVHGGHDLEALVAREVVEARVGLDLEPEATVGGGAVAREHELGGADRSALGRRDDVVRNEAELAPEDRAHGKGLELAAVRGGLGVLLVALVALDVAQGHDNGTFHVLFLLCGRVFHQSQRSPGFWYALTKGE